MKRIAIVLVALVGVVAAGVLIVPRLIDWNQFKPDIEAAIGGATGGAAEIKGEIAPALTQPLCAGLPTPHSPNRRSQIFRHITIVSR